MRACLGNPDAVRRLPQGQMRTETAGCIETCRPFSCPLSAIDNGRHVTGAKAIVDIYDRDI